MAEIKDKVVTAESLKALHDYSVETFETKENVESLLNDKFDKPDNNIVPIVSGGTGASDVATARSNLGITPANIGAEPVFDVLPIAKGGTSASNGATGLKNLFASGATVLSSFQYGDTLPAAGTVGRIFFKKLSE